MGRGNGVRPASKTTIEIDFYYHGVRCKERLKLKPTPANLKRAERHRAAVLDAIERGTFDYAVTFPGSPRAALFSHEPGAAILLRVYLDRWLKEIRPSLKASTFTVYRRIVNHQILGNFGDEALTQITWKGVRNWLSKKDASAKTKGNILSVFRTAFDDAVEDELLDANPLAGKRCAAKATPSQERMKSIHSVLKSAPPF
jgi:integrase